MIYIIDQLYIRENYMNDPVWDFKLSKTLLNDPLILRQYHIYKTFLLFAFVVLGPLF